MDKKIIAAYHEAGHAVVAFYNGYNIRNISIDNNGGGFAEIDVLFPTAFCVKVEDMDIDQEQKNEVVEFSKSHLFSRLEEYSQYTLAGYFSEFRISNTRKRLAIEPVGEVDPDNDFLKLKKEMKRANEILGVKYFDEMALYLWKADVMKLLRRPKIWKGVETLAQKLIEVKGNSIPGEIVTDILRPFIKQKSYSYLTTI